MTSTPGAEAYPAELVGLMLAEELGLTDAEDVITGPPQLMGVARISYDAAAGMVRLANDSHWTIFSLNGNVVQCGFGSQVMMKDMPKGSYLVRVGRETLKVVNPYF